MNTLRLIVLLSTYCYYETWVLFNIIVTLEKKYKNKAGYNDT